MILKTFLLSLALAIASLGQTLPVVEVHLAPGIEAIVDRNDLGNTWYSGDKVKLNDEYLDILNWMVSNGAPSTYSWHTAFTTDQDKFAPTSIVFTCETGPQDSKYKLKIAFDAVWTFRSPTVTLSDVRAACGKPLPNPVTYPGYKARTDLDPVGEQRIGRIYNISPNYNDANWPLGSIYKRLIKKDGIEDQEHYERTFIVSGGGGFLQPSTLSPAWLRLR